MYIQKEVIINYQSILISKTILTSVSSKNLTLSLIFTHLPHNIHNSSMQKQQQFNNQQQYEDQNYGQYDNADYDYDNNYGDDYYIEMEPAIQYREKKEFEVLPYNALFPEVVKHLKTAKEMIALEEGWCLLLLRELKWDVDMLGEYFQDIQKYRTKIAYDPIYKHPSQLTTVTGTCQVCCAQQTALYENICTHRYCQQCWKNHLQENIKNSNPFIKCMGCTCPVLFETILHLLQQFYPLERKLIETYQKLICQQFSTIHRNYQFCTGVDCGNCIKVYNLNIKSVKCTCGKVFCFKCKSDDHSPCSCEQKKKWMDNVLKEEADAKWMSVNAKLCPWCKKAVERSAGCNFMACVCGKNFCYLCSRPWQPDHKDHFKCHIYKHSSTETVSREKQILEKMNFYTQRYLDNQATAINNKRIDTFQQRKLLFTVLKIDLSDSQFIDTAYKFSIECCQCLKWIYAYTFYSKWKNQIDQESFKFDQGEFEKYKVNLLKMLAVDLKNFIIKVKKYDEANDNCKNKQQEFIEEFKQLKKTIVNYFTMTKKYKEKFIDEIQNRNQQLGIGIGMQKKKSSKQEGIQRKQSQKKQKNSSKIQTKQKQTLSSKIVTRSVAQKEKLPQQPKKTLAGWFSKNF